MWHVYTTMAMARSIRPVIPNAQNSQYQIHTLQSYIIMEKFACAAIPGNVIEIRDAISGSPITTLPGHTFLRFII